MDTTDLQLLLEQLPLRENWKVDLKKKPTITDSADSGGRGKNIFLERKKATLYPQCFTAGSNLRHEAFPGGAGDLKRRAMP